MLARRCSCTARRKSQRCGARITRRTASGYAREFTVVVRAEKKALRAENRVLRAENEVLRAKMQRMMGRRSDANDIVWDAETVARAEEEMKRTSGSVGKRQRSE